MVAKSERPLAQGGVSETGTTELGCSSSDIAVHEFDTKTSALELAGGWELWATGAAYGSARA